MLWRVGLLFGVLAIRLGHVPQAALRAIPWESEPFWSPRAASGATSLTATVCFALGTERGPAAVITLFAEPPKQSA